MILYIVSLVHSLCSESNDQFNVFNMYDTLLVLRYLLQSYLALCLWTISIVALESEVRGFHTEQWSQSLWTLMRLDYTNVRRSEVTVHVGYDGGRSYL